MAGQQQHSRIWRLQSISAVVWQGDGEGCGALPQRANTSGRRRQRQRQIVLKRQAPGPLYAAKCSVSATIRSAAPCRAELQKLGATAPTSGGFPVLLLGNSRHAPTTHSNDQTRVDRSMALTDARVYRKRYLNSSFEPHLWINLMLQPSCSHLATRRTCSCILEERDQALSRFLGRNATR